MTNLLLRIFIKNYEKTEDSGVRSAIGKFSGIVGIVCNLLLCVGKLLIGILSGAVSIVADAINNLTDATSSVVTLIGFKLASMPADEDHPYGHARFEYLSGLAVAALIMVMGVEMAKSGLEKIFNPAQVSFSVSLVAVLAGSILIKLWMFFFNRKLGKKIQSSVLLATAADSRNDCIATFAVLLAAVLEAAFGWQIDGIMALAVAIFILINGWNLAKETISPLLGEGASTELREQIAQTVSAAPLVLGYHDLMVHDYGPGQRFASIHVEMDRKEDPLLCHEIIDNIERECLQKHNVHLVIHYDPLVTDDAHMQALRQQVSDWLLGYDGRLLLHDFRMVEGAGHTNLIFDVTWPRDLLGQESKLRRELENALAASNQSVYYAVITFDPDF